MIELETALQTHLALCEEACALFMEENRALRHTGSTLDQTLLTRKRALLGNLDRSLSAVRQASRDRAKVERHRSLIAKAQQTLLRAMLLDRENEQLLLKSVSGPALPLVPTPKPTANNVRKAYGRSAA